MSKHDRLREATAQLKKIFITVDLRKVYLVTINRTVNSFKYNVTVTEKYIIHWVAT